MSDTQESPSSQHMDYGPQEPVTDYATALRGPEVARGTHTRFSSGGSITIEPTADANVQVMVFNLEKLVETHPEYKKLIGATTNVKIHNMMHRLLTARPDLYDDAKDVGEQRYHEEEIQEAQEYYDTIVMLLERRKLQDTDEQRVVWKKEERQKLELMRKMLKASIEGVELVDFEKKLSSEEYEIFLELKPQRFRKAIVSHQIPNVTPEENPSEEKSYRETQRRLFKDELSSVTEAQITFTTQEKGVEPNAEQLQLHLDKLNEEKRLKKKSKTLKKAKELKPQTPGSSPSGTASTTPSSSRGSSPPRSHVSPSEVGAKTIEQIFDQMRSNKCTTFHMIRKAVVHKTGAFKLGNNVTNDFKGIRSLMRNLSFEFADIDFDGICRLLEQNDPESMLIGEKEDRWFLQILSIVIGGEGLQTFESHRDDMVDGFDKRISGVMLYHSLYKELTPHTLMNRIKAELSIISTGTMDGKVDLRGPPTKFIYKIRESARQFKAMYKEECMPESRLCDTLLTRLPKIYDGVVKRLGVKSPDTKLTLLEVQELLITQYEHNQVVEPGKRTTLSAYEPKVHVKGTKEGLKKKTNPKLAQQSVQRSAASNAIKAKHCDNCGRDGHTWNTCWKPKRDSVGKMQGSMGPPPAKPFNAVPSTYGPGTTSGAAGAKVRQKKQFAQAQGAVMMNSMNHIHENWEFATEKECETAYGCSALSNSGFNLPSDDNSSQGDTEYLSDDGVQSPLDQVVAEFYKSAASSSHTHQEQLRKFQQEVLATVQKLPDRTDAKLIATIRKILNEEVHDMQCSNHQSNERMYDLKRDVQKTMSENTAALKHMGRDISEIQLRLARLVAAAAAAPSKSRSTTPAGMHKAEQGKGLTVFRAQRDWEKEKLVCRNCDKEGHTWGECWKPFTNTKGEKPNMSAMSEKTSGTPKMHRNAPPRCDYCGKDGHIVEECRELQEHLFPWSRTSAKQVAENIRFAKTLNPEWDKDQENHKWNRKVALNRHITYSRTQRKNSKDRESALEENPFEMEEVEAMFNNRVYPVAYSAYNASRKNPFIVDSGASAHLINDKRLFDKETFDDNCKIKLDTAGGGMELMGRGTATININGICGIYKLVLKGAYLHRASSHNLISISKLQDDLGLNTNLGVNPTISDKNGKQVIKLQRENGVYTMPVRCGMGFVLQPFHLSSRLAFCNHIVTNQPENVRSSLRISRPSKRRQEAEANPPLRRKETLPQTTSRQSASASAPPVRTVPKLLKLPRAEPSTSAPPRLTRQPTRPTRPVQPVHPVQPVPAVQLRQQPLPLPRNPSSCSEAHDDLMLHPDLFKALMEKALGQGYKSTRLVDLFSGVQYSVNNANADRYYSLKDSAFHHMWVNIDGWANCPYDEPSTITTTLIKGVRDWQSSPSNTSLTVLLPVWENAEWSKCSALSKYEVIHEYPEGSHLFVYPPHKIGGDYVPAGATKWPVRAYHLASATHTVTDIGKDVLAHARLGHPHPGSIPALLEAGTNLGLTLGPMARKSCKAVNAQCGICRITKATRPAGQSKPTKRDAHCTFGDLAYMDMMGLFIKTPEGHQHALVLEDDATGYKAIGTMVLKSDAHEVFEELLQVFKNAKAKVRTSLRVGGVVNAPAGIVQLEATHTQTWQAPIIRIVQSDNAPELIAGRLAEKCKELGISQRRSNAYRHQNEAIIERTNRSIQDKGRAMLYQANLPPSYWAHAFKHAVYLLNRLPTNLSGRLKGKSPYQMLYNTVPDLGKLKTFGCKAFRWNDYDQRTQNTQEEPERDAGNYKARRRRKLNDRATELTLVGMDDISPTYLLVNVKEPKKIIRSGMLAFDESSVMAHGKSIRPGSVIINALSDFDMEKPDEQMLDSQASTPFTITEHRVYHSEEDNEIYAIVKIQNNLFPRGIWTEVTKLTEDVQENAEVLANYLHAFYASDFINAYYPIFSFAEVDESLLNRETQRQRRRNIVEPTKCILIGIDCKKNRSQTGPSESVTIITLDEAADVIDVSADTIKIHGRPLSEWYGETIEGYDEPTMLAKLSVAEATNLTSNHRHVKMDLQEYQIAHEAAAQQVCSEPKTLSQAKKQPDWQKWKGAIDTEFKGLHSSGTFTPVSHLPKGKVAIQTALKFKLKKLKTGEIDKYKARLVAHGQTQEYGVNYTEVFAPASQVTTVTLLLILAVSMDLKVWHMDVYMAFLNSPLEEDIYIAFPDNCGAPCKFAHLHRALYGLKQAAAEWAKLSHKKIMGIKGMRQSSLDPALYYLVQDSLIVILLVHVDDYMVATNQDTWWPWFIKYFSKSYECKDLGILSQVVGVGVEFGDGFATLTREKPIQDSLKEYGLVDANPVLYPMESKFSLPKGTGQMDGVPFLSLIGSLRYHERTTRPDICLALARMSKYCNAYDLAHYDALKRILRYLKGTVEMPFLITKNPYKVPGKICFSMYSDATWAETSSETLGYTIGWHIRCNGNPLFSKSKVIDRASLSSTQSEVVALSEGCKDLLMFHNLVADIMEVETPMTVYVDNTATIHLVNHPVFNNSSKYIGSRSFWTRDLVTDGIIKLRYIKTSDNIADYLTKPLSGARFKLFRDTLMGHRPTDPEPEEIGKPTSKTPSNQDP
jgi:hypothetical protein